MCWTDQVTLRRERKQEALLFVTTDRGSRQNRKRRRRPSTEQPVQTNKMAEARRHAQPTRLCSTTAPLQQFCILMATPSESDQSGAARTQCGNPPSPSYSHIWLNIKRLGQVAHVVTAFSGTPLRKKGSRSEKNYTLKPVFKSFRRPSSNISVLFDGWTCAIWTWPHRRLCHTTCGRSQLSESGGKKQHCLQNNLLFHQFLSEVNIVPRLLLDTGLLENLSHAPPPGCLRLCLNFFQ